jgi:hypothetical protein
MPVNITRLDGTNLSLEIPAPSTIDLFSLDLVVGTVTSSYLPQPWLDLLTERAKVLFTAIDVAERAGGSLNLMQRLLNVSALDDSVLSLSSVVPAPGSATLRIVAAGVAPAHVVVNLPHSMTGGVAVAGGVAGPTAATLSGVVTGPTTSTAFAAQVLPYDLFGQSEGTYLVGEVIARFKAPRAFKFYGTNGAPAPANSHSMTAKGGTTTIATCYVKVNGAVAMTCAFASFVAAGTVATITVNDVDVPQGADITVEMPTPVDTTLAGVSFTLRGDV